jgi:hypothetical protein
VMMTVDEALWTRRSSILSGVFFCAMVEWSSWRIFRSDLRLHDQA